MAATDYLINEKKTTGSLLKFLKGPSIPDLYKFMSTIWSPEKYTGAESKQGMSSLQESITYAALHNLDPLCVDTIEFLWEILACLLQKLALTILPEAIYISGGVVNYLAPFFKSREDLFPTHFLNHNQMREQVLEKVQVFVVDESPTLNGL